ncbi:hypothetical protein ACUV84_022911 [Puccinellia chinampoensis]
MAPEFGWWPMSPWLSPGAAWFIFFNVVVGAIAVMSSSRGQQQQQDGRESSTRRRNQLVRTASTVLLDSLRSISLFSFHSAGDYNSVPAYPAPASQLHHVHEHYHTFQEQETQEAASAVAEEESVVLPQRAPVAALGTPATAPESHAEDGESAISLDEAYALARATRQSPAAAAASAAADTVASRVPGRREPVADVKVRPGYGCGRGTEEEVEGKAEVNARAEQFIRQFREELKLERINSILNYSRGAGRWGGDAAVAGCGRDRSGQLHPIV